MRPQLKEHAETVIKDFIRQKVEESGATGVIVGLSGGIDSAVVSKLCADAIGASKVLNIFMPSSASSEKDRSDAESFSRRWGMEFEVVSVEPVIDAYRKLLPSAERRDLLGNVMTRTRMIVLFHHANLTKRVVMGTSNKSELLIGYGTIHGDLACAFNPMGDLFKTQVRELGTWLGLPKAILEKVPTAGLWPGQTDEGELGISYAELDAILVEMVDRRKTVPEIVALGFKAEVVERVADMVRKSEFKRKMPPIAKISARTIGHDFLYPFDREK